MSSVYIVVFFYKKLSLKDPVFPLKDPFSLKDPVFEFEKKRNEPLIYDRELWTKTGIYILMKSFRRQQFMNYQKSKSSV